MSVAPTRSKRRRSVLDGKSDARGGGKRALYHCNYCNRNISEVVRIKCAVCLDFDLCVECCSVGVELGQHKNTHAYRVMDYLSFPLFHPAWGADEEMLLLEAIDMYGIGNWQAVGEHVGEKTAAECKLHYYQTYIESPDAPAPCAVPALKNLALSDLSQLTVQRGAEAGAAAQPPVPPPASDDAPEAPPTKKQATGDAAGKPTFSKSAASGPPGTPPLPQKPDPTPSEVTTTGKASTPSAPKRGGGPAGTAGGGASGGAGRKAQAKVEVTGYMRFRDEFDPEYDAEAELPIADLDFQESDPPELTAAKLRQLEIYNERLKEREARREIIKAQGLTDVRKLINAEKRRSPYERRLYAAMRVFERYQSAAENEALVQGFLLEQRLRARIEELKSLRRLGARTFSEGDAIQEEKKRQDAIAAGRSSGRPDRHSKAATDDATLFVSTTIAQAVGPGSGTGRPAGLLTWRGRRAAPLDITILPGVNLLSRKERELCSAHRLLPSHLLLLKETLMREVARSGPLTRADARSLFRLEPSRAQRLHELAVTAGWIPSASNRASVPSAAENEGGVQ